MRLFSRDIDDLGIDALKRLRDKLREEISEESLDLEHDTKRKEEKGKNKFAIERFKIMGDLEIAQTQAKLDAVLKLIANIEAETASTAPE